MKLLHVIRNGEISFPLGTGYLVRGGYVPCCTNDTLKYVLSYYLSKCNIDDLSIIEIDSEKIDADVKWEEWKESGNIYPHVYGMIGDKSVVSIIPVKDYYPLS